MRKDTLSEAADRLHEDALEAIRGGSIGRYEEVLDTYQEALLAFPTAWARYGQRFDYQAARGSNLLGIGQTERFLMNLGSELREAARSDVRDIAFDAAYMPARIARGAFELDAIELSRRTLGLTPLVYSAVGRGSASEIAEIVKEKTWRHLYEFARYPLEAHVEEPEGVSPEEHRRASEFLRQVFAAYNSLLLQMVELRDLETLREADKSWSRIFLHWEPEHEEPFEELVDATAYELGEADPRVKEARQKVESKMQQVAVKEDFFSLRTACRYGLCFWALRRLRESEAPSEWILIFEYLASYFKNVEQIIHAVSVALAAEDTLPWSDWILSDLPQEEVHFVGADPEILRAFVTLMLLSTDLEARASFIGPLEWMPVKLEQVMQLLDEVLQDEALKGHLLPSEERLQDRAESLRAALRQAAEAQKGLEEEKIRESPLAPGKLENFKRSLHEGWSENRLVAPLFQLVGSYEESSENPPGDAGWFGTDDWLPKDMFVTEPQVYGAESIAHQFGFSLANGEMNTLLNRLSDSPSEGEDAGPLPEKVHTILQKMAEEGYSPSVILAPMSWRLMRDMDIEGGPRRRNTLSPPEGIPPKAARNNFRGLVDEVPVFGLLRTPKDRIWIVDLAAFATCRQWLVNEKGEYLRIEFEVFNEEQALDLAREYPNVLQSDERESVADRAAAIRSRAYLRVRERFEIKIEDQKAARRLDVPEELR